MEMKKDIKKIKHATKEELNKLQEEYKAVAENIHGMSPAGLLVIAVVGVLIILYFKNSLLDLLGLALILYTLYIFIQRDAHRKGYFEGYYEMMTKLGSRDNSMNNTNPDKPDQE